MSSVLLLGCLQSLCCFSLTYHCISGTKSVVKGRWLCEWNKTTISHSEWKSISKAWEKQRHSSEQWIRTLLQLNHVANRMRKVGIPCISLFYCTTLMSKSSLFFTIWLWLPVYKYGCIICVFFSIIVFLFVVYLFIMTENCAAKTTKLLVI